MILWNRDRTYKTNFTIKDREAIAYEIASPDTIRLIKWLNIAINVCVLSATIFVFKFNLVAFAIAFVLLDMLLCVVDHFTFIVIPHWATMHVSLKSAQKRVEKLKAKQNSLKTEIAEFKTLHCNNCYRSCSHRSCYRKSQSLKGKKKVIDRFIKDEELWINYELDKIKEQEIQADKKQSKDYSDKKEYLIAIGEKLEYCHEKHNMDFLISVTKSITTLIDTLNKKPMGYTLVSSALYIYLDELQNILNKWVELNDQQKKTYAKDIGKISEALSQEINRLIDRITKLETEDIEVGIAVLLKELTESGGEVNV